MAPIKSCEDPTVRFAKLFAMLYYHMCEQLCRELGEERGKKAIEQAVFEFGRERIRAMHEEARERGIEVMDNPSYHLLRDMPNIGWINSERGWNIVLLLMCGRITEKRDWNTELCIVRLIIRCLAVLV